MPEDGDTKDRYKVWAWRALILAVTIILILGVLQRQGDEPAVIEISYSEFKTLVREGRVTEVTLADHAAQGTLTAAQPLGRSGTTSSRFTTGVPAIGDPDLIAVLERHQVSFRAVDAEPQGVVRIVYGLLPWLIFLALYLWFARNMYRNVIGGVGRFGDIGRFLEGSTRAEAKSARRVTFADVAGQDNAKREVAELVDYLRNPDAYTRLGAEVPHGVLLMGPPGTGKTLLARALAGEAETPFFSVSASEFIEVFVGVGASRVRRMFEEAKKRAPSIIFIDELDAVGRVRGAGLGGGHDEREQTLNQILAEMDGFSGHEAVIVLAATNRPDVLDPALLRPGRFDRHVTLDLPDRKAREEILAVHTRKVPIVPDVDLARIAAATPGFSGADLKNLVNEAAMMAAREKADRVAMRHFEEMRDRVLMGAVRSLVIQPEERHRLAVHEAGHAMTAHSLPHADPLHKVTIIPRGRTLGATYQLPGEDRHTLAESYLRDRLAVMMGGRTAEKEILGEVSSGADDDIRQATALARAMVSRWGMSSEVGPMDVRDSEEHPFLGREIAQPRHASEETARAVDAAVRKFLHDAETTAAEIIRGNRPGMDLLVAALEARESLDQADVVRCVGALSTNCRSERRNFG